MRIAFQSNQLGIRGTEITMYLFAHYNEVILGNKSYIVAPKYNGLEALEKFKNRFEVFLYDDFSQVDGYLEKNNITHFWATKAGNRDEILSKLPGVKNLVMANFALYEPHGDVYSYASKWLSQKCTNGTFPYVPCIVELKNVGYSYKQYLNIPEEAKVFGYHGGPDSFNLPIAQEAVYEIAKEHPDIYFIFMNSNPFCENLPNVIHIEGTFDLEKKSAFINTCDACIHGRIGGETFGLAVAEFSVHNKPVITFSGFPDCDLNHIEVLGDRAMTYRTKSELKSLILNFDKDAAKLVDWNCYKDYTPEAVIQQFKNVYLNI